MFGLRLRVALMMGVVDVAPQIHQTDPNWHSGIEIGSAQGGVADNSIDQPLDEVVGNVAAEAVVGGVEYAESAQCLVRGVRALGEHYVWLLVSPWEPLQLVASFSCDAAPTRCVGRRRC